MTGIVILFFFLPYERARSSSVHWIGRPQRQHLSHPLHATDKRNTKIHSSMDPIFVADLHQLEVGVS
jgi:hypothetical protein